MRELNHIYILLPLFLLVWVFTSGQTMRGRRTDNIIESAVANLPSSPSPGTVRIVTDGADDTACDTGLGTSYVLCSFDGDNWVPLGAGGTGSPAGLDASFDIAKIFLNKYLIIKREEG